MCKYQATLKTAKALAPIYGQGDYDLDKQIEFMIGNGIFQCRNIDTNKCTEDCQFMLRPGIKGRKTTWEHMWGRRSSAVKLIEQIKRGRSDKFLVNLIKSRTRVNMTTKAENQKLKKFQNDPTLSKRHPNAVYKAAGLKLVDYIGPKVYNIEGNVYDNRDTILATYKIDTKTLTYRLTTKCELWEGWYIEYME